jgi:hypothetical protein
MDDAVEARGDMDTRQQTEMPLQNSSILQTLIF